MKIKNIFYTIFALLTFTSCEVINEDDRFLDVELKPSDRVVLLTEFTGWNCVNCPSAAAVAHDLVELIPDNVVIVGMHPDGHGFTAPTGSALDLRSKEAMEYLTSYGGSISTGLPAGVINGKQFDKTYIQVFNKWTSQVIAEREVPAQCLISMKQEGTLNDCGVKVTISPKSELNQNVSLQIWLLESAIVGPQNTHHGYEMEYVHNHVFRKSITSLWGDELGKIAAETVKNYKIEIASEYKAENCSVVAVVINTETKEVVQAAELKLK